MGHKKINPNRIPVSREDYDLEQIKEQATKGMVLQEWAVILAAQANLEGMTTERIMDFWRHVDRAPTMIHTFADAEKELAEIRTLTGFALSIQHIEPTIHTRGDLIRFERAVKANAVATAFAIIAEPMIREEVLPLDELQIILQRALSINEEIADGEISVGDIQEMLQEEYNLRLSNIEDRCTLDLVSE